ncbi:MAG: type I-E CRISPR-associated protein Cas6/Cse3/CasE [Acidimicrobiia bacterium]
MAHLSRIRLNPRRNQARRFFRDPHALHAAVLAGLVRQPVRERTLWRLDTDDPLRPALLVLTESVPSWEHLVEQAGWPSSDDPYDPQVQVRSYEPLLERLDAGQEYAFRLTANPVSSTRNPDRLTPSQRKKLSADPRRSRTVAHRTTSHQLDWLLARQEALGIEIPAARASATMGESVPDVRIIDRARRTFRRNGSKALVTIQTATYEGRLCVIDPDLLRSALTEGVGRAKAYGCGLLTLAPCPTAHGAL